MTIAYFPTIGTGERVYSPVGPIDTTNGPFGSFRPGEVVFGDGGAKFMYCTFVATAAQVLKQGDLLCIDNSFVALKATSTNAIIGMKVGTFFCGGRFGDPAAASFSSTFGAAGTYGMWVQVDGVSLLNCASTATAAKAVTTTATAGQADAPTGGQATGTKLLVGVYLPATSYTFTASAANASLTLTSLSTTTGIYPNQTLSGTGVASSQTISSINGNPGNYSITLSAVTSATASTATMTATGYIEAYLNNAYVGATGA